MRDAGVPIEWLDEAFVADFDTGILIWRERPREHFTRPGDAAMMNARFAGKVAGCRHPTLGYVVLNLTIGGRTVQSYAHRIIWAMRHRRWPASTVDHIDGVRDRNAISNLREATKAEQPQSAGPKRNATGFPGVTQQGKRFSTGVTAGGKYHHVGTFDTAAEAYTAYLAAKAKLHGFDARVRG